MIPPRVRSRLHQQISVGEEAWDEDGRPDGQRNDYVNAAHYALPKSDGSMTDERPSPDLVPLVERVRRRAVPRGDG